MIPWQNDDFAALRQHLVKLEYAARQMIAVLLCEYESLKAREVPSPSLLHEKAGVAADLETARNCYKAWRQAAGTSGKIVDDDIAATLTRINTPGAESLRQDFDDTRDLLLECDRHNAINGRMLHRQHLKNQLFSRLLKQNSSEPLYSSRGQLDRGAGSLGRV